MAPVQGWHANSWSVPYFSPTNKNKWKKKSLSHLSVDKKFTWSLQGLYLNLNYNKTLSDNAIETGNQITALKEKVRLPASPRPVRTSSTMQAEKRSRQVWHVQWQPARREGPTVSDTVTYMRRLQLSKHHLQWPAQCLGQGQTATQS